VAIVAASLGRDIDPAQFVRCTIAVSDGWPQPLGALTNPAALCGNASVWRASSLRGFSVGADLFMPDCARKVVHGG
jgi:hypothetical protein